MPVFALGRAQEMLLILDDYWDRNPDLHGIPIYYNSPLASKCLRIFETYTNMCSEEVQEAANRCNNPWILKHIKNMPERHKLMSEEADLGACVVMAAPGMMQSGASRELFESWAPDKRNGVIVTGYSVDGTLAHELKKEPESISLPEGRKIGVRATVKFITFSAHSDYNQTSEFIRKLKANVVVLVHGEEYEMGRMRGKLREEYPELSVVAPQNCMTVSLRVPPDRSADAVGKLVEELAVAEKRQRKEGIAAETLATPPSGKVVVEDANGTRLVVAPEELSTYTTLSACQLEQCQRFQFPHSLAVLGRALRETYDDVEVTDEGTLNVCDCVIVAHDPVDEVLSVTWQASPVNDLVADSVSITAVELTRSPTMVQALQSGLEAPDASEARLFRVICAYLNQEYGDLTIDEKQQSVTFEVDGSAILVDFPRRVVSCDNELMKEKVRLSLLRCESSLRPVAAF